MDIILASTSPYRRRLLERLHIPFRCIPPGTDESPRPREAPQDLAQRLALTKARAVAHSYPEALVIGSDQVAALGGRILGKPGDLEAAAEQLRSSSGQAVEFYTAVAVAALAKGLERFHVELTTVRFRELSDQQIANYLQQETPFDCAGSFKVEGLGIALFTSIAGDDPTALEGLPLIQLTELLGLADVKII